MSPPARRDLPDATLYLTRGRALRFLAGVSNTSAIVFTTFLGVHLASPVLAAFGGGELASQVQLLGRAYYHPLEPYLIYAPLGIHILPSLTRRLLLLSFTHCFPNPTPHLISGYLLLPLLIPHILTHRLIPLDPTPPISSLSPSELDYTFVGYALRRYAWTSWAAYLGISAVGVTHAVGGWVKIATWLGYRSAKRDELEAEARGDPLPCQSSLGTTTSIWTRTKSTAWSQTGAIASTLVLITIGLVRIRSDSADVGPALARRIEAVFNRVPGVHF